jgi:predicted HAD superfamily phosphohydrolase YqeG
MKKMGTDKGNTLFVGDQLFTDIWGANNAKLHSILVKPIAKHEEIQIILKRIPEKLVLFFYKRKHKIKTKM